jgi:hypothetical protein
VFKSELDKYMLEQDDGKTIHLILNYVLLVTLIPLAAIIFVLSILLLLAITTKRIYKKFPGDLMLGVVVAWFATSFRPIMAWIILYSQQDTSSIMCRAYSWGSIFSQILLYSYTFCLNSYIGISVQFTMVRSKIPQFMYHVIAITLTSIITIYYILKAEINQGTFVCTYAFQLWLELILLGLYAVVALYAVCKLTRRINESTVNLISSSLQSSKFYKRYLNSCGFLVAVHLAFELSLGLNFAMTAKKMIVAFYWIAQSFIIVYLQIGFCREPLVLKAIKDLTPCTQKPATTSDLEVVMLPEEERSFYVSSTSSREKRRFTDVRMSNEKEVSMQVLEELAFQDIANEHSESLLTSALSSLYAYFSMEGGSLAEKEEIS